MPSRNGWSTSASRGSSQIIHCCLRVSQPCFSHLRFPGKGCLPNRLDEFIASIKVSAGQLLTIALTCAVRTSRGNPMEHYPVNFPDSFLEDVVKAICSNDPCAMAIYLFGLYARGEEHSASDIDIYVVTKDICSFIPDEGREAAREAFRQLIKDYGLNPSVLTYGPLRDFAERIHIVAFEERSVWTEGIALWESEDYRRQAQRFSDEIVPSDIYREEIYDYGKRAHFYWRCLHRVEGDFRIPEVLIPFSFICLSTAPCS